MSRLAGLKRRVRRPLEHLGLLRRPPGRLARPKGVPGCRLCSGASALPSQAALFASVHRLGPLLFDVDQECWVVVGHGAVLEALRQESWFSNDYSASFDPFLAGSSGESHQRFRQIVQRSAPWFDKELIEAFPREWLAGFFARMEREGGFDAVGDLGVPLPRAFTVRLRGLDPAEAEQILRALHPCRTEMNAALKPVGAVLTQLIEERRRHPSPHPGAEQGLFQALIQAEAEGLITDEQVMSLTRHLWFAGTVTLGGLLPACVAYMSSDPVLASTLRGELDLVASFVSEVLRLESITQSLPRCCTGEGTFSGQRLQAGDLVLLHLGAANRDPAVIERPDEIRLERQPYRHLALGVGSHVCLGSVIARTIAETCLQELLQRSSALHPRNPAQPWRFESSFSFRALQAWPTTWEGQA